MTAPSRLWPRIAAIGAVVLIAAAWAIPVGGETVGSLFFASLRLAKPKPDTAGTSLNAPLNGGRRLQDVLAAIVAESAVVVRDEASQPVSSAAAAEKAAGFRPRLLAGRSEAPSILVLGAQRVEAAVNPSQLRTLLAQAGNRAVWVPQSLEHAAISFDAARGVRVQYGNCPAPVAQHAPEQIQGPPPPSTDNASCVVIAEVPIATSTVPAALDTTAVLEIALELMGMSPNQARDFRRLFGWRAAVAIVAAALHALVRVGARRRHHGMLMITGGRRGPTYVLTWVADGIVYHADRVRQLGRRRASGEVAQLMPSGSSTSSDLAIETRAPAKGVRRSRPRCATSRSTVQRGEIFGFLGPNGAGKSTSIKMLLGLVHPTGGEAFVLGAPVGDVSVRRRIGFLPEDFRFYDWLTATELLELHGRLAGMTLARGRASRARCTRDRRHDAARGPPAARILERHAAATRARAGAASTSRS